MGNRAVIKFVGQKFGIYLHWNGGRDSVEPFLAYCKLKGFRSDGYGVARFAQVVGNWFGGGLSLGIVDTAHRPDKLDCGDNGVYYVKDWEIVRRYPKDIVEQHVYDFNEFLLDIDSKQPEHERLGKEFLTAKNVKTEDLKIGDKVFVPDWKGVYESSEIVGFGDDKRVNGHDVKGVPFVNRFGSSVDEASKNPNNYLFDKEYRVAG